METITLSTPLWLGLIIVFLGYAINIVMKWIDVQTNGEKFIGKVWWQTNKLNMLLSVLLIAALLLLFPELPEMISVSGSEVIGERLTYLLIGYAPYKIFKTVLKKTSLKLEE